jgi:hypothetical protein
MPLTLVPCRDCIFEGWECLLPVAALPKLRSFEVDECAGLGLYMLRRFLEAAVQGPALKVDLKNSGISYDAMGVYFSVRDEKGEHNTPIVKSI